MICPKCQVQNEESAQFCRNCGVNLHYVQETKSDDNLSDMLLLAFIIICFISFIGHFVIEKFVDDWYNNDLVKYVSGGLYILGNASSILPAIAIKNTSIKIVAIILSSIYIIYYVYQNITWLFV